MTAEGRRKGNGVRRRKGKRGSGVPRNKVSGRKTSGFIGLADIAAKDKECVLLITDTWDVLAWYPDEQLVARPLKPLLPEYFVPSASSSSGLLCGIHRDDILADLTQQLPGGTRGHVYRLAVANPATGFQLELPHLYVPGISCPIMQLGCGNVRLHVRGDQDHFTVFFFEFIPRRECPERSVFTFDSSSCSWTSSKCPTSMTGHCGMNDDPFIFQGPAEELQTYEPDTERWSVSPFPGGVRKMMEDLPLPEELTGFYLESMSLYRQGDPEKVMAVCQWTKRFKCGYVVLEFDGESDRWKTVSWSDTKHLRGARLPHYDYMTEAAVVGGQLVVLPTSEHMYHPVAFHLQLGTWIFPPLIQLLSAVKGVQPVCVYTP